MQILNGKEVSLQIQKELAAQVKERKENGRKIPHLA
ncbi:MAG: hypothetical protein RIQ59_483, partial [Bacteroidota bacterium]